jgi:hypothetical protein
MTEISYEDHLHDRLVQSIGVVEEFLRIDLTSMKYMAIKWPSDCGDAWRGDVFGAAIDVFATELEENWNARFAFYESTYLPYELLEALRCIFRRVRLVGAIDGMSLWSVIYPQYPRMSWPSSVAFLHLAALGGVDIEDHGFGVHLHPEKNGRHLGYKLLFDPERTQQDLSWEDHGHKSLQRPWGDPSRTSIPKSSAEDLYHKALFAVRNSSKWAKKGERFRTWAKGFERPGRTAYFAHPPVTAPIRWRD